MSNEVKLRMAALRWAHFHEDCTDANDTCPVRDECSRSISMLCDLRTTADLIESLCAELEQVKQERDGLNILLGQAQSMLETRTRERDAAVEELKRADIWSCEHCKFNRISAPCGETNMDCAECKLVNCICKDCIDNSNWQWRGVQEEVWL